MIFITLGQGVELGIDDAGNLFIHNTYVKGVLSRIDLGKATRKRFKDLTKHIGQLEIHAVEEKVL